MIINESKHTGTTFKTPKGGTLTVIGTDIKNKCVLHCSLCSKDEELWPVGSITTEWARLKVGQVSCGCSGSTKWREWQYKLLVARVCREKGYLFLGWNGIYTGKKTKIILENKITGFIWNTSNIDSFFKGHGDPQQGYLDNKTKQTRPLVEALALIQEVCEEKEYIFKGWSDTYVNSKSKMEWECKLGHTNIQGLIHFTTKGKCRRCGINSTRLKRKTPTEVLVPQLKSICDEEGLIFIGYETPHQNTSTKFKWICSSGHDNYTSASKFLTGRRCRHCCYISTNFGFYKEREEEQDYLYVYLFQKEGIEFLKVGRTFRLIEREKENLNRLRKYYGEDFKFTKLAIFTDKHKNVFDSEQHLIHNLKSLSKEEGYGSSECIYYKELDKVLTYCKNNLEIVEIKDEF